MGNARDGPLDRTTNQLFNMCSNRRYCTMGSKALNPSSLEDIDTCIEVLEFKLLLSQALSSSRITVC